MPPAVPTMPDSIPAAAMSVASGAEIMRVVSRGGESPLTAVRPHPELRRLEGNGQRAAIRPAATPTGAIRGRLPELGGPAGTRARRRSRATSGQVPGQPGAGRRRPSELASGHTDGVISLATGYLHSSLMPLAALRSALAGAARLPDTWERPPAAGLHGLVVVRGNRPVLALMPRTCSLPAAGRARCQRRSAPWSPAGLRFWSSRRPIRVRWDGPAEIGRAHV